VLVVVGLVSIVVGVSGGGTGVDGGGLEVVGSVLVVVIMMLTRMKSIKWIKFEARVKDDQDQQYMWERICIKKFKCKMSHYLSLLLVFPTE
jgi:hypothetical protein